MTTCCLPTSSGGTDFDRTDLKVGGNIPLNEPAKIILYICHESNENAVIIEDKKYDNAASIAKTVSENPG